MTLCKLSVIWLGPLPSHLQVSCQLLTECPGFAGFHLDYLLAISHCCGCYLWPLGSPKCCESHEHSSLSQPPRSSCSVLMLPCLQYSVGSPS